MKRIIILSFMVAATMTTISCTKDKVDNPVRGEKVSFTFDAPVILDEGIDNPDSRVAISSYSTDANTLGRPNYRWSKNDKITILSYSVPDGSSSSDATAAKAAWANSEITVWNPFTAKSDANKTTFEGYLPASFQTDAYLIIHNGSNDSYNITRDSNPGRYNIKYNIPSQQDGTGLKYCLFGARPQYDVANKSFSFIAVNNVTTGNSNISAYNNNFGLRSALTSFEVPADAHIRQITITASMSDGTTAANIASNGTTKDIQAQTLSWAHSGGSSNTITISKNGEEISGLVYFASRQLEGKANQYYPILTFVFTNADGKTATRVVKLATNITSATSFTLKNIYVAYLTKLGAVTFDKPEDFQN